MGNILFVGGIFTLLGLPKTVSLFIHRKNKLSSVAFCAGILLVFIGWVYLGLILELVGAFSIFGPFISLVLAFAKRLPVIGPFLRLPVIAKLSSRLPPVRDAQSAV
jgi:hypothetical protein